MTRFIENIRDTTRLGTTKFGDSPYSQSCYVDHMTRTCIMITPRAACTVTFQHFLDMVGLLKDGRQYDQWIHNYRGLLYTHAPSIPIEDVVKENYTIVKFIINPYRRAVSIFYIGDHEHLSFRSFLRELMDPDAFLKWTHNSQYHSYPQYIPSEETIVTRYIRADRREVLSIVRPPPLDVYRFDISAFSSPHHVTKHERHDFCGDLPLSELKDRMPSRYKLFYDDEIRQYVESIYADDIAHYGYTFEDEF